MKKFWADFKKFISRGNVIDMAVGVAVASAFTAIVTAFTKGFITPLIALLTNGSNLAGLKWVIRPEQFHMEGEEKIIDVGEVALLWGDFFQAIVNFLIVAFTLFLVVRIASKMAERSLKIREKMINALTDIDEKAAALAAAKTEEEAKAKAEAEAAEAAKAEAERIALEKEESRKKAEIDLLTEIRDLLKTK